MILVENVFKAFGRSAERNGANRFVRVLRGFFRSVIVRLFGNVVFAEFFGDKLARRGYSVGRNSGRVRSYISDKRDFALARNIDALVKRLSRRRSLLKRHAEFIERVLLHRTRNERCGCVRLRDRLFDFRHHVVFIFKRGDRVVHFFLGFQREFLFVQRCERKFDVHTVARLYDRPERPVFFGLERTYFAFALDYEPKRNGLNSARRQVTLNFFAKHRGNFIAHESVEHSSRLLCVDEIKVDFSRVAQAFLDGFLRNFVKLHPDGGFFIKPEYVCDMPRDCFAFAIRVGREIYCVGLCRESFEFFYRGLFVRHNFVLRFEILFHVYGKRANGQVADMTFRSKNFIVFTQIFFYRLNLSGTFDYNKFH